MILEAFAQYLHNADPKAPATEVLAKWLWEKLSKPPVSNVDRVIHCEFSMSLVKQIPRHQSREQVPAFQRNKDAYIFKGTSESGKRLLKSLYEYCCSYEQQKWSRWVHTLKASDFNDKNVGRR